MRMAVRMSEYHRDLVAEAPCLQKHNVHFHRPTKRRRLGKVEDLDGTNHVKQAENLKE
jgi:hypothetical protein